MDKISIYIHVPFCQSKCIYCDFASFVCDKDVQKKYFERLIQDVLSSNIEKREARSIYFGGGTPSIVEPEFIEQTLQAIKQKFVVKKDIEISIECNPCSVTLEKLKKYRQYGINRVSFGVQSFDNSTLKFLGRRHNAKQAEQALIWAKEAGFENISADLLIGVDEDENKVISSAQKLVDLGVKHISAYMLQIEENTPLYELYYSGQISLPSKDQTVDQYALLVKFLAKHGYKQYEVSNFAQNGYKSCHNLSYWRRLEYIGYGVAANSFIDGERSAQPKTIEEFLSDKRNIFKEKLSPYEQAEEIIMLGLRFYEGVDLEKLNEFGYKVDEKVIHNLLSHGFISKKGNIIKTKPKFYTVLNLLVLNFIDGLQKI